MRHEQLANGASLSEFDIVAVWPGNAPVAPVPLPDLAWLGDQDSYEPLSPPRTCPRR